MCTCVFGLPLTSDKDLCTVLDVRDSLCCRAKDLELLAQGWGARGKGARVLHLLRDNAGEQRHGGGGRQNECG